MIKPVKQIIILVFILITAYAHAQTAGNDFKAIDEYVKALGPLDTLNMGTISYIITKKFSANLDKSRAIFDWIAYNISYDCKAGRSNSNDKNNSDDILRTRKATAPGYAALFQDMCSVAKIRCLTVDGYAKQRPEQMNEKPDEFNHTWAVVQLGQSPQTWFYVDPTWGSGYTDDKITTFTKAYNDAYFFADKTLFNFQHFPDNPAWLLGTGAKNIKEFLSLPLVKNAAYEFKVNNFIPANGSVKTKTRKPVSFSFKTDSRAKIDIVALAIGEDKKKKTKTVDFIINNSSISFNYKFEEEDSFPVTILVNNKPVLGYIVEVTE